MFWALFDAYKVNQQGVMKIYQDGGTQLLASEEIPADRFMQELEQTVSEAEQNGDVEILQQLQSKITPNPETDSSTASGTCASSGGYCFDAP